MLALLEILLFVLASCKIYAPWKLFACVFALALAC